MDVALSLLGEAIVFPSVSCLPLASTSGSSSSGRKLLLLARLRRDGESPLLECLLDGVSSERSVRRSEVDRSETVGRADSRAWTGIRWEALATAPWEQRLHSTCCEVPHSDSVD